jgi:phosphate starvation-inducible PhoH-like protein
MQKKTTRKTKANKNEIMSEDEVTFQKGSSLLSQIKLEIKYKNATQKNLTNSIKTNDLTICTGPAGTGKTYISCLQALHDLKNNDKIKKIVLVKSVTTLKSEEIGFLKGTMEEKMEPFMYSFTGNFEKILGKELFTKLKAENFIEIMPIAYLRGVNIDNAIVIIDETQNITIGNIRTILTRLGENSKMVFLGDVKQIDSKNKYDSALKFLVEKFVGLKQIGVIEFNKSDIVRHPIIKVIEDVFDKYEEENEDKKILHKIKKEVITESKDEKFSFLGLFRGKKH